MQDTHAAVDESNGTDRRIGPDRLTRALTQQMAIEPTFPLQFAVTHDGREHDVDVEAGACTCEDHQYRGDSVVCKHQCAAAVYGVFTEGIRTRLQARVLSATRELGCPHGSTSITDGHDCAGPLGRGVFPCPECVEATPGDWSAWNFLTNGERVEPDSGPDPDTGAGEQAVATDGGHEQDDDDANTTINAHGDEVPARSEPADFGGGEGGMDEL